MTKSKTDGLSLYQYDHCPYCVITRRMIDNLELDIEMRNTLRNPKFRSELIQQGGKSQVPCLRIDHEGSTEWLYESHDIIAYLNQQFG